MQIPPVLEADILVMLARGCRALYKGPIRHPDRFRATKKKRYAC